MNRIFMLLLIAIIAVLHNSSCAGTIDSDPQRELQLRVGKIQVRLEDGNGACRAIASAAHGSAAQYALNVPWPCRFHTDKAGNVRTIQGEGYTYCPCRVIEADDKPFVARL